MNAIVQENVKVDEPWVLRSDADGICTLTLNRPQQFNLLTSEMIDAVQAQLDALAADESVRVVILTGAGKGFCAGHDLKEIRDLGAQPAIEELFACCSRMMVSLAQLPQPVIARVQGAAAAAGCQLVAQCDLAVAADSAKFTTPGVNWGFFCSTPGVALARNLPRKRALELLLTGDMIDAATALQWGLLNRVVPMAELDAAVGELARKIAAKPRATVAAGKRAFYRQAEASLEGAYAIAGPVIAASFAHEEGSEGMAAFIDKRKPNWVK
jgi:enoyl-CoA hydratase/carnithine racemase